MTSPSENPSGLAPLARYAISPRTGFVPEPDPLVDVPEPFAAVEAVVQEMPGLIRWGRLRSAVRAMPEVDVTLARTPSEQERLFLALTMLTNAWVWGGERPDLVLPASLARPVCALGRVLDRPPVVSHASMCLQNWRRIDPAEPVSTDNAELLVCFLGGADETWFSTATLGVELAGGAAMATLHEMVTASALGDLQVVADGLARVGEAISAMGQALARMREWCDPDTFFRRLRPFLASWPAPGLVYEGVSPDPVVLAGGSAAQSTLVQVLDAALGVEHGGSGGAFLRDMRGHMPIGHRRFVDDVEAISRVREVAAAAGGELRSRYDAVIEELDQFRRAHMGIAVEYVAKPSRSTAAVGTGGTDFTEFLHRTRTETSSSQLG